MDLKEIILTEIPEDQQKELNRQLISYAYNTISLAELQSLINSTIICLHCDGRGKNYDTYQMGVDEERGAIRDSEYYAIKCHGCNGSGWRND